MKKETLGIIKQIMSQLNIPYELLMWKSTVPATYFVGEYRELEIQTEDCLQETTFTLTGFSRNTMMELEDAKDKIEKHFRDGYTEITSSGLGVAIFYGNGFAVPSGNPELKKLEIDLTIKEWKVN